MTNKNNTFEELAQAVANDDIIELSRNRNEIEQAAGKSDVNGRTLLHLAAHSNATNALAWLIDHKSGDVNAKDNMGETPLMRAAWLGNTTNLEALLEAGARLDETSLSGGTALHYAYAGGKVATSAVQALLAAGADPKAQDKQGKEPEQWKAQAQAREQAREAVSRPQSRERLTLRRRGA